MTRTNLVLDAELLNEARKVLGARTYSATVNEALAEVVRIARLKTLPAFFGSGIWEGDLSEMREDRPVEGAQGAAQAAASVKPRG